MTGEILTHEQVLAILSQQAQDGSVTAAAALERALRARERALGESAENQLDRLLKGE